MIRYGYIICFLFLTARIYAQQVSFVDVLSSALSAPDVNGSDRQIDWLKKDEFGLPWVNSLEFRTRNNELLLNRQQYAFRLDLENPIKIVQNRKYFEAQQQLSIVRRERIIKENLTARYLMLVQFLEVSHRLSLEKKKDSLIQKLAELYHAKAGLPGFNADDLISVRMETVSSKADLREAEFEFSMLQSRLVRLSGVFGSSVKNLVNPVSPELIAMVFDSIRQGSNPMLILEKAKEVELASRKSLVDKSSYSIGWIQGMYVPYKFAEGERTTGMAMGITIPLFNKNKDEEARDHLDVIEAETALQKLKRISIDQWVDRKESLRLLIDQYQGLKRDIQELENKNLKSLDILHNYDPLPRIKLETELLKFDFLMNKIRYEIVSEWILFLDDSDIIGKKPYLNYLSGSFEKIE